MNVSKVKSVVSALVEGTMTGIEAYSILRSEGIDVQTSGNVIALSSRLDCAAILEILGIEASEQVSKSTSKRVSKKASKRVSKGPSNGKLASKLVSKKVSKKASEQVSKKASKKVYSGELLTWEETEKAYLIADSGIEGVQVIGNESGEPWGLRFGSSNVFTRIDRIESILEKASELGELIELLSEQD